MNNGYKQSKEHIEKRLFKIRGRRKERFCRCGKKVKEVYLNGEFKGYRQTCGKKECYLGSNKGRIFSKIARENMSKAHKGKKLPINQRIKIGDAIRGEKHPSWKGGNCNSKNPEYMKNWFKKKKEKIAGRSCPDSCEICGAIGKIVFDHDHKTGKFRGWICERCNFALGHARDNAELLEAMANYLRNFRAKKMSDVAGGF